MVARFPEDNQVYRANVTAVREGPDTQTSYDVLYIDYGNSSKGLSQDDLWGWDSAYEMIPPQAYLCSFNEFPIVGKMKSEVFKTVMSSQEAMKMEIIKVNPLKSEIFKASDRNFGKTSAESF